MRKLNSLLMVIMITSGFVFTYAGLNSANVVYACSCIARTEVSEFAKDATAVFRGKVTSTNAEEVRANMVTSLDPVTVKFEVYQVWKGDAKNLYTIQTALESASCGFNFEKGEEYIVYASTIDGKLEAGLCSGTALATDADIEKVSTALGEGELLDYPLTGSTDDSPEVVSDSDDADEEESSLLSEEVIMGLIGLGILNLVLSLYALMGSMKKKA